ncbi:exonuclease domain-containing protein [Nocardia sp. NPDC058640]|uniref:exonuclease domain-containing protein n=1 Tax=Nocardia sp. NPDC058640 TaxID=3346571 RepID=UPI00365E31FD
MTNWTGLLNVVDVEATCWTGDPPPGQTNEIIEIGITVVDLATRTRLSKHGIIVRPTRSTVSEFCTELTTLTQQQVDQGIDFAQACRLLTTEFAARDRPWASWGDYDRNQFRTQCAATGVDYPFGPDHTNAKLVFTESHALRRRPGMDKALKLAELPLDGTHHRGEDDAWNIAALVVNVLDRDSWRITTVD